jgi:hypothetical protein
MNWIVRPVAVGTAADTPSSLRAKAAEFLRLAAEHKNPAMIEELHQLALRYMERAKEIEASGAMQPPLPSEIKIGTQE